jgi:membrane AbrB-like protein
MTSGDRPQEEETPPQTGRRAGGKRGIGDRLRAGLRAFSPSQFPYPRFFLAIAIGVVGAVCFSWFRLPLPWMLGPLTFCTVASLAGAPVRIPTIVRPPMNATIGVVLGANFSASFLADLGTLLPSMIGLVAVLAVSGACGALYLRYVAKFDLPTAYFGGMPGGLTDMVALGEERGADIRAIALVHSGRILLTVFSVPFIVQMIEGVSFADRPRLGISIMDTPWTSHLWLVAVGLAGAVVGRRLRLPAPNLFGPLLASAAVHLLGWSDFKPSFEIASTAQLVIGTYVGCTFAGTPPSLALRTLAISVVSAGMMLLINLAGAFTVSSITNIDPVPLMLAYSAGGFAEMSLVALALHIEVAFVTVHHLVRVLLVIGIAGVVFRLAGLARRP